MKFQNEAIHTPKRLFLRRALFQVHLWTGIGLGLYMLLISVSGAAIVFQEEMENALYARLTQVPDASGPQADYAAVMSNAQRAYPAYRVRSVSLPTEIVRTFSIEMRQQSTNINVYAHPVSGEILGHREREGSFLGWLNDLHHNLLAGKTGRLVNGFGALFLLLLCITGLVIWWPGVKNWTRALTVDFGRKWKRVNWDLHSAVGFWSLLPIAMWAVTGAYFTWPDQFRSAIGAFSPISFRKEPMSDVGRKALHPAPKLRELVLYAQQASPHGRLARIAFPDEDRHPIRVILARGRLSDRRYSDNLYFDQFTGELLLNHRRGSYETVGDAILYWIAPLHFGTFGGVGIKIFWVAIGLAPAILFLSGGLMWWNRRLSKKWARLRTAPAVRETIPSQRSKADQFAVGAGQARQRSRIDTERGKEC